MAWHQWAEPAALSPNVAGPLDKLEGAIPMTVGSWVGQNVAETDPPHAVNIIHRKYENIETGQQTAILYVRSRNPRDLVEYEPQRWYGNRGWRLLATQPAPWKAHGVRIPAVAYEFAPESWTGAMGHVVNEFWILPDGRLAPTLAEAQRFSEEPKAARQQGAAMVRIVLTAAVPRHTMRQITQTLITPIVETITAETERSGEQR